MIALHLFRQYHFCPRIVYFLTLTDIKPVYPRHVKLGEDFHHMQDELSKNRRFKKLDIAYDEMIRHHYLESEVLDICGEVDLGLIGDEAIPVEYKHTKIKQLVLGHKLQLIGYGLLLEKHYAKPFKRSIVIYGKNVKFFQVPRDDRLEKQFWETYRAIKEIELRGTMPYSSANANKCLQCEYLNFCDDRF